MGEELDVATVFAEDVQICVCLILSVIEESDGREKEDRKEVTHLR